MNNANRRGFLKIAGAGVAGAGVASFAPTGTALAAAPTAVRPAAAVRPAGAVLPAGATGSMVAYIHDVSRGEVAVMIEGREVTVVDHELVARLATAIHSSSSSRAV